ncbi:unnamed protein product [Brachionus calyciflorus]|uniref:Uncharacterized protein n=1 Tax=Brachionus calyciflorus TaxID=104777 RepID=A0A813M6S7_9BILA|nr:unnamed protein product [Brachionus calyciflorus]
MGSKNTKAKKNSVSALEDHSFQTKLNTEMNAKIGKIVEELIKNSNSSEKTSENMSDEKSSLKLSESENKENVTNLFEHVNLNEPGEKKRLNPILVHCNSDNSFLQMRAASLRVKRLQNNKIDPFDEEEKTIFKKSKRKGVRFSDEVIIINNFENENFQKNKRKSSIAKTDYIKLVSLSNFVIDNNNNNNNNKKNKNETDKKSDAKNT